MLGFKRGQGQSVTDLAGLMLGFKRVQDQIKTYYVEYLDTRFLESKKIPKCNRLYTVPKQIGFKKVQQDQCVTHCEKYLDVLLLEDAVLLGHVSNGVRGQPYGHPVEAGLGPKDLNRQERV